MGAPGAAMDVVGEARPWWESRLCIVLVVFATMLPLLYPPIPPLVDLFGHMGRYRVEIDLGHSPWLREYYDYHWALIGNLGVDFLVRMLAPIIGQAMAMMVSRPILCELAVDVMNVTNVGERLVNLAKGMGVINESGSLQ